MKFCFSFLSDSSTIVVSQGCWNPALLKVPGVNCEMSTLGEKIRMCIYTLRPQVGDTSGRQLSTVQPSFRQTEYHKALPSSVNDEVRCDCMFANDGNAS